MGPRVRAGQSNSASSSASGRSIRPSQKATSTGSTRGVFGQGAVAFRDSGRQHLDWRVEELQLHGDSVLSRPSSAQVALPALPHAALVDHRQPSQDERLGQLPLEALDGDPRVLVINVEPKRDEPLVGAHAHCALRLELLGQGGLAGARQPAQEDQPATHRRGLQSVTPGQYAWHPQRAPG
jgi:hypothetical protein